MSSTESSLAYELTNANAVVRFHYLDNLRALAMIGGVFFHAALAYSPLLHNLWLTADSQQSSVVDIVVWFSHLFRMPLFFLIAGFFVAYLVTKRGMKGMLLNRAKRILLPFVIFLPLCLWAIIASLMSAVATVENKSPVLQMVAHAIANPGSLPPPPFSSMHLWFLYSLILFCLLTWVLSYINWSRLSNLFASIKVGYVLVLFPLLLLPGLFLVTSPTPAPDQALPQFWSFGFFGLFFVLGYWMFGVDNFIARFQPYGVVLFIASIVVYAIYYTFLPKDISFPPKQPELYLRIILKLCEAYIAVWMTLVCLVAGKRYLNSHNRVMRFFSDSSYWIYIIHVPLLFIIQYQLLDMDWSLLAKYSVSVGVTLFIGMLSYVLFVRWTPIGWMLNGRKKVAQGIQPLAITS